mmetsp:Transcript_3145/g.5722  ORF Transcript_3145/g.5722 Transcript_3145/m.5722 type:complete len:155 (+) Transcript_3145:235-699(+)
MAAWAQFIVFFFPIPFFCLVLLSISWPKRLERFGANVVNKIFFTKINGFQLLWLFFAGSLVIFANSIHALHHGPGMCRTCQYQSEILWYSKAMKFRAERNFWLSLFNVFLWVLVWRVHCLKRQIIQLKDGVRLSPAQLVAPHAEEDQGESKKDD